MIKWYKGLPKAARFCLYYGTAIFWMPVAAILAVIAWPFVALFLVIMEAYDRFEQ
jgi:hypothetical protein